MDNLIFLPGLDKQINYLINHIDLSDKTVLIIGVNSEEIAKIIQQKFNSEITIIVDNYDSLIQSRLNISGEKKITVKLMEYENTDFNDSKFDLVYAQASISTSKRNKIVKEIKRILKPDGYFCVGENVNLTNEVPVFVNDIWSNSNIVPLNINEINNYYSTRNFEIIDEVDLSKTLKDFYFIAKDFLRNKKDELSEEEKISYKKVLKKISHESNAYLNLGGDHFIGFKMLLLKKI